MLPPIPMVTSLEAYAALLAVAAAFTRVFLPRARRRLAFGALLAGALVLGAAHAAWAVGPWHFPTSYWGATLASASLPVMSLLVASLPLAALVRALLARLLRVERGGAAPLAVATPRADGVAPARDDTASPAVAPTDFRAAILTRRAFVQAASAAVPLAAGTTGLAGFLDDAALRPRPVPIAFDGLPRPLAGLRILQLSDLHLGCTRHLSDLERLLVSLERRRPDLVVLTGDVAEDTSQLAPALRLVSELRPRLGVFASLGNHEYLRGIRITRPLYERSPVPLLVDAGCTLDVGGARLRVTGVDDPVTTHADVRPWFARAVDRALDGAPSDAFHLMLAHRPEAFDAAHARGVGLVLSGHTHGGQIGYNGKSAFQPIWPERYLWGLYARGASRLYTTSGFGDWYPFRLGCPREAPIVELARG